MRSTQNGSRVLARKKQEREISCTSLQESVDELIESLQGRAESLNKKRCTLDDRLHWMTRGRQQTLRRASTHLRAIGAASLSSYTLYLALQDYLACLEKYEVDVEEEKSAPVIGIWPVEQWKAEGEAQELSRIVRLLSRMVQTHTPDFVRHTLSLDGKRLVSLRLGSEEQGREQVVSAQPLQVLEAPRLLVDSHGASERVPTGNEQNQERASLPICRGTYVPTLGPFPILPDEASRVQQTILLGLEDALSHHGRVLVNTERIAAAVDTVGLLLMFLDRVLQYTPVERILVLAGSPQLLARLSQRYRTWVSLEDGVPLSERYAAQYKPTVPLASDTQICFSSVREMQVVTRSLREQDADLCRQIYDLIITCDLAQLSAPWQQVLASFDVPYYVGFGAPSDQLVAGLFDHNTITPEVSFQGCECADQFHVPMNADGQPSLSR